MILVLCSKYGRAKNNCRKLSWKSFAIDWSPHKHRAYFCLSLFWISREAHWTRTPGSNTTPFQTCINIIALVVLVFFLSFFLFCFAQLCPTLCNLMDCSPPASSVHRILQARIPEWIASFYSRGSSWPRDQFHTSCTGGWTVYHCATREAQLEIHKNNKH